MRLKPNPLTTMTHPERLLRAPGGLTGEVVDQVGANSVLQGPQRHTCLVGGSRAGKTIVIIRAILIRALRVASRHAAFRFRSNAAWPSLGMDTIPFVADTFFPDVRIKPNLQHHFYELPNGSEFWIGGLDTKERTERILGNEYATIFLNECSQIPYSSALLARTRLAQNVGGLTQRAYYDLNPVGRGHWTNKLFGFKLDPVSGRSLRDPEQYVRRFMVPANNPTLAKEYLQELDDLPEKQRLRFKEGVYIDEASNALWNLELLDVTRVSPGDMPPLKRVVVAVDPSGAGDDLDNTHDAIGIIVVGLGADNHAYVLADYTLLAGPREWAAAAVAAYHKHKADRLVAEENFGGAMVEFTVRTVDGTVSYKKVQASRGKVVRAEPISALYGELRDGKVVNGRVHHVLADNGSNKLQLLEAEMCEFTDLGYTGERSPNRADALVWALTELMLAESSDGWLEFYRRKAAAATAKQPVGTEVVTAAVRAPSGTIVMKSPEPHQNFYVGPGRVYVSDKDSLVHKVDPVDIPNLERSGCRLVREDSAA